MAYQSLRTWDCLAQNVNHSQPFIKISTHYPTLTHWGRVTHVCVKKPSLVHIMACRLNGVSCTFIQENALENAVCEMVVILSRPQYAKCRVALCIVEYQLLPSPYTVCVSITRYHKMFNWGIIANCRCRPCLQSSILWYLRHEWIPQPVRIFFDQFAICCLEIIWIIGYLIEGLVARYLSHCCDLKSLFLVGYQ